MLLPDIELLNDFPVTFNVFLLQVIEQPSAFTYEPDQLTFGHFVVSVDLEMTGKVLNAMGKKGNLTFG